MTPSSRTPEGRRHHCQVCGQDVCIEPSSSTGDATCPNCGCLLWFRKGRLVACFQPDGETSDVDGLSKEETIRKLVRTLVTAGRLAKEHEESVVAAILEREAAGSTAIGRGIAVPHAKHASATEFIGAVGLAKSGIDFDALDREPVYLVLLLVSPLNRPGDELRLLSDVTRTFRDVDVRQLKWPGE